VRSRFLAPISVLAFSFSVSASLAADLPATPAYKAPAISVFNWTGFYAGAHIGYGWGNTNWTTPTPPPSPIDYDVDGFLAGGQIGFNVQSGPWVWGVEADISWTNADGSVPILVVTSFSSEMDWLATLTGRIGYASGPGLFYVKGGAAWVHEEHIARAPIPPLEVRSGETRSGWTVGVGYEYDFGNSWSAKLEYSYLDFGEDSVQFPNSPLPVDIDQDMHVVKWGVNYRFATGPM